MTARDLVELSVGNLWRKKLRALLTTAGVVIAIATFVAMLSFAAGNHRYFTEGYNQLGLFTRVNVFPAARDADSDTTRAVLDREAAFDSLECFCEDFETPRFESHGSPPVQDVRFPDNPIPSDREGIVQVSGNGRTEWGGIANRWV